MTTAVAPRRLTLGGDVAAWIEEYCVQPTGANIGEPFVLMDWQRKWLEALYECDDDGTLKYRWALLGIPKKNGKSSMLAALALYHLLGDPSEFDPYVVCAAASDKQADIVFGACKRICELSPTLRDATIRYRWTIEPKGAPGKLERVAASKGRLDGKNISFLVLDELHEFNLENWTILTGGTSGRKRAQIVQITTAGFDKESICYREYDKGLRIQSGDSEIKNYLFTWYGAPEGADHRDEQVWEAANPSYETLVGHTQLADKYANIPESQFRRYHLNQWVEAEELWLPAGAWEACAIPPKGKDADGNNIPGFELEVGYPTFVGWDASTKHDSTAVIVGQWREDRLYVKAKIWERPLDPNGNPVEEWEVPGVEVAEYVRDVWRTYRAREIAYDPAFITWKAQELATEGAPMLEFFQSDGRMIPATQVTYDAILNRTFAHDGDPVLARHIRSAMTVMSSRGGQRLTKGKQRRIHNMIDGAVALTMMGSRAMVWVKPPAYLSMGGVNEDDPKPEFAAIKGANF